MVEDDGGDMFPDGGVVLETSVTLVSCDGGKGVKVGLEVDEDSI